MSSSDDATRTVDPARRKAARVAGFMFLFSFIIPTLNWVLMLSSLVVPDDAIATGKNIAANEPMFRVAPNVAAMPVVAGICYAPSGIIELVVGAWLLFRSPSILPGGC